MKETINLTNIQSAIQARDYILYYQPKFEKKDRRIIGAEALIRLKVGNEILLPAAFLHIVVEMGEMENMQTFLIHEVVAKLNSPELINLAFSISINMNSSELVQQQHMDEILSFMRQELINPKKLEVEITERREFPDLDLALLNLSKMKELGVKISLDDFGKGFNSLAYLRVLPIDTMKIDRLFISDILTDFKVQTIVNFVIELAHALGIAVVAEGVETLAQVEYMDQLNCDLYQGFYFARPTAFSELQEKWLPQLS